MREIIALGDIVVSKIDIKENPTDMMSKPLPIAKFDHFLNLVRYLLLNQLIEAYMKEVESPIS